MALKNRDFGNLIFYCFPNNKLLIHTRNVIKKRWEELKKWENLWLADDFVGCFFH